MRKLTTTFLGMALLAGFGCNDKSEPGGPGATGGTSRTPALTQPQNTFTLDTPNLATDLRQGETKVLKIGINRGRDFAQDVKLEFTGAPQGVTVTPNSKEIKASANDVEVTLQANRDAALGEHTITVTGTPVRDGPKGTSSFRIQVKKAE